MTTFATDLVAEALGRATTHLLSLQSPEGWWQGELETNVTMDAEDLLMREFIGVRTERDTVQAARWIRSQQRPDGTWANFAGGPPDLSTTVEAYAALRLAGDPVDAPHLRHAASYIREAGGIAATRVFTRMWLALFGQWSWDALPVMPPELVLLPSWVPLNVYDWACWARQTIVPLTIVGSLRPVRPLPFDLAELATGPRREPPPRGWALAFTSLDRVLHRYERRPLRGLRRAALRRAAEWIVARQELDGSWGGIQPPWVYSLIALHLLGYGLDHPVMRKGLTGLDRFTIREETPGGVVRRLEACQSPVWDTALALVALRDAGVPCTDPAVTRAVDWVLGEEIHGPGDWQVRRPAVTPGGWAFEFDNDGYPDTDDTAEVLLALSRSTSVSAEQAAVAEGFADAERSTVGEGPASAERHAVAEGYAVGERSVVVEQAVVGEQAVAGERSVAVERAVVEEQAVVAEGPAVAERSTVGERSVAVEQAVAGERSMAAERAVVGERSVVGEQAVVAEGSAVAEQCVVDERRAVAERAVARGVDWLVGMASRDGGWAAFDADNTRELCRKLPFCDFGAVIDPPSADVTAHVVEALCERGMATSDAVRRGVIWLLKAQEADGSWFGRWGANHVYGTGAVIPALIAAGVRPEKPCVRRAVHWLTDHQNADGGWGEDLRSYKDPAWIGRGASTPSQTAWALLALIAAGERSTVVDRGIAWLVEAQRPDGGWDEPQFTGTGFPGDFYINYHLYRLVFPISALGRYVGRRT